MTDANVIDLDQVNGVAPVPGSFLGVVIRRDPDHTHARDLVLARPADLISAFAHDLRVVVVVVLMADGHDLGVHPAELEADRGRIRIGDHSGTATPQSKAPVTKPCDVQCAAPLLTSSPVR